MAKPVLMPQVGQDLTEGTLVELRVGVGDSVAKGDIVAVVESEKASFEVEAFDAGTVLDILYKEGDTATVLEPLLFLGAPGERIAAGAKATSVAADAGPEELMKSGSDPNEGNPPGVPASAVTAFGANGKLRSSPLARRLAGQHGLDLAGIVGTGSKGSIVKRDIDAALARAGDGAAMRARPAVSGAAPALWGESKIAMRSLRDGVGDPLLLLHGFGSDVSSWRPIVSHIGVANPIVALDLPGHGASAEQAGLTFEAVVESVEDALAQASLTRLHLAGHSLGGAVGAALAGGGGLDIRSLTLIAPAGLGPKINGDFIHGFCAARTEEALAAWLKMLVHDPAALPGALVRATMRARASGDIAGAQARLAETLFPDGTQVFSIRAALEAYAGPLRAIVGREDAIIPSHYAEALPSHAGVHRLVGIGHLPQLEAPALVGRLLAETVRSAG